MSKLWKKLEKGEIVILDYEYPNYSAVEVVWQSPNNMFTKVKNEAGAEWEVMTDRLTQQKQQK